MNGLVRCVLITATAAGVSLVGCEKSTSPGGGGTPEHARATAPHDHGTGSGHDHDHDDGETMHGAAHDLGVVEIGGSSLRVTLLGDVHAGHEVHLDITHTGGERPSALRLWIGDASGAGAMKSKADGHDDHFHAHVEAPSPIPAGAALWIEVETSNGTRTPGSIALPMESDDDHGADHGHEHG